MVKKCSEQKNTTLNTKICQKYKQNQDDAVSYPNLSLIIFDHFVIVSHQYGSKM